MARPLRIEFSGAIYHVTARGNAQQDIYLNDADRDKFLSLLHQACERYHWLCHAYCLMSNHYHLLIETNESTLSKGMKFINGGYTQAFNRRHRRVGHIFQGRFKAILIERDSHLLELARYIVLNPVRAQMVISTNDWPWSSYSATAGFVSPVPALSTAWILQNFANKPYRAEVEYRQFVRNGKRQVSPRDSLKNQIYLGSDDFIDDIQHKIDPEQSLDGISKLQTAGRIKPLAYFKARYSSQREAMAYAYLSGHYTLTTVGRYFGVSYMTVSRAVKTVESPDVKCET
jgi:REP element-mobilizing transposase RayT